MQYNGWQTGWQTPKFSAGTRASESIRVAFLCLLSLALGGRETLLERTCFSEGSEGVLERMFSVSILF